MKELTHFSLFTGIGGIDLAAEWAGFKTVGQCEFADYPTKVLEKHWPDVPRWKDVRELTVKHIWERGIGEITLLSGGFPCQPHSVAGKRKASGDERDLWPEYRRLISEIRPKWVLAENVPGLLSSEDGRFFREILRDFAEMGFDVGWCTYPAAWVGANHKRERVFVVGYSKYNGLLAEQKLRSNEKTGNERRTEKQNEAWELTGTDRPTDVSSIRRGEDGGERYVADTESERLERRTWEKQRKANARFRQDSFNRQPERWAVEPDVGRVANGIPRRVDRLKCLGNAVVPQQVYPILKAIADIERGCT